MEIFMNSEIRIILETVCKETGKVVKKEVIEKHKVKKPGNILELGLRHSEQIELLSKIQNYLLQEQCPLIREDITYCPNCGKKLSKQGCENSDFHAVFSDHKLPIQRLVCPKCKWRSIPSIKSLFGTSTHPDLAKLQIEMGSLHSYRNGEKNLELLTTKTRAINNHVKLSVLINSVGEKIEKFNCDIAPNIFSKAEKLIVQVDGAHIPDNDPKKRSFEALLAVVYRPESLTQKKDGTHQIVQKHYAASAKADDQKVIKKSILSITKREGLYDKTEVTVLCDGAKNRWNAIELLRTESGSILKILDWFHIGMKFRNAMANLSEEEKEKLEKIKWCIWHGKKLKALNRFEEIISYLSDPVARNNVKKLYDFIKGNHTGLVNYEERKNLGLVFTSQLVESTVEDLVNSRCKNNRKATWSREGAHNVLQIRVAIKNGLWEKRWLGAINDAFVKAA